MQVVTYRTRAQTEGGPGLRAGRLEGDQVIPLSATDVGALVASGPDWAARAAEVEADPVPLAQLELAPVIPRPPKIVCVGQNYRAHIAEMGAEEPRVPTLFAKYTRALIGAHQDIRLPTVSEAVDWEVELVVVIGREVRDVDDEGAKRAIAGFTVGNDVSVRDWQRATPQWLAGKTHEATTPLGPALVTPDEVDGGRDLELSCAVDGEVKQRSRTSDMVFTPAAIVSYVSRIITLDPGDVIFTGTPEGVGAGRDPQEFLRPGQTLQTTIEGIGTCTNPCVGSA